MLTASRACAADAVVLPIPTLLPAPAMTSPVLPALQTDPSTIARVPYAPDVLEPAPPAQRSVVVDRDAAERLSVMSDSALTIRLFVEGRDDSRRAQPKTFERRFADTLSGTQRVVADRLFATGDGHEAVPVDRVGGNAIRSGVPGVRVLPVESVHRP